MPNFREVITPLGDYSNGWCLCEEFPSCDLPQSIQQKLMVPSQVIKWVPQCPVTVSLFALLLCATATVSPCTPGLWVSAAAEAPCLLLLAMLEGVDRSRVLLLWVTHFFTLSNLRKNPKTKKNLPKALDISCHEDCSPYFFRGREPTDYSVTIQWSFEKYLISLNGTSAFSYNQFPSWSLKLVQNNTDWYIQCI